MPDVRWGHCVRVMRRTKDQRMVTRDGIAGYSARSPHVLHVTMEHGDRILFYTDGVRSHFAASAYPKLLTANSSNVARRIVELHGPTPLGAS